MLENISNTDGKNNLANNPLVPIAHKSVRIPKISILKLEGIIKKFPMSVATMSRFTKRAYLRLSPEKRRKKKEFRH